jgi:chromosome segregation ATPase
MNSGFPNLSGGQEDLEESFWSSFSNVMMVILKIFLLVIVIMALNNRNLLDDLKNNVQAKEEAQEEAKLALHLAQSSLKANASLEEQLAYFQQRSSSLDLELLRSRAEAEGARNLSNNQKAELNRLQALNKEQADTLVNRNKILGELQGKLTGLMVEKERTQSELAAARDNTTRMETELSSLRTKYNESDIKLLSLQGEFTELDKKYQKLLKPARSASNKQVVEVLYQKTGYSLRKAGEGSYRNLDRASLENELGALKTQFGNDLYVRIVIPDNSGLSYSEAWSFTNQILSRYDYYYNQTPSSAPAPPVGSPSPGRE